MPSESPAQRRLMAAAAHDAQFAAKVGVPQSVAREFHAADKRKRKRSHREDVEHDVREALKEQVA